MRERVSCRSCEAVSQPPAPSHPIARGYAGPDLLALVLAAKYGQHLPLTRQSAIYAREGVEIDVSTMADWVGAAAATLMPLVEAIRAHVLAAERLHGDDTTVPVLAKERTRIGRLWAYVRDDRPFAGPARPRAIGCEGAGGWLIASQRRQLTSSRTCSTTFQRRGSHSSVSVTSSPSLRTGPPHLGQAQGAG